MVSIVDNTVIDDLSDEADWGLGAIFIEVRHVHVIQEVDQGLGWWRTVGFTGSLVNT